MAGRKVFNPIVAKRGKQRLLGKRPAGKKSVDYKSVKYVRAKTAVDGRGVRKDQVRCCRSLPTLLNASNDEIVRLLIKDGMLPDWSGKQCPRCNKGKLSSLMKSPRGGLKYRCSHKSCHIYMSAQHLHPWFTDGNGTGATSLQTQSAVLLLKLQNISNASVHQLMDVNHKVPEDVYNRLTYSRQEYVIEKQKNIQLGGKKTWVDVEGDEASFGKADMARIDDNVDPSKPVMWEQWCGLIERGRPDTLILERLQPATTEKRSPGPGPIRKTEWQPIGKKYLEGRNIIFHTDSARSYKARLNKVVHDNVVHCKKKVKVNGKWTWQMPKYVKVTTHTLPGTNKTVKTKAGTQIVDRAWRYIKDRLSLNQSTRPGSRLIRAQIQGAQFQYWHKNEDPWKVACKLSHFVMQKIMGV